MSIISAQRVLELAKEAGFELGTAWYGSSKVLERFAALVRAEDDPDIQYSQGYLDGASAGKLEGRAEREWVDLTDDEVLKSLGANSYDEYSERELANAVLDARAVITAFKEKNK